MRDLKDLTLEEKIGQMLVFGFLSDIDETVINNINNLKAGNIILFARNCKNNEQLFNLNKKLNQLISASTGIYPLISIDQEGGMVTRIQKEATFFPGAMTIGATGSVDYSKFSGAQMGKELLALGCNMNLAPTIDINNNPLNPVIGVRSFSDDPETVAKFGNAFIEGLQKEGVIATVKHFPGHGDTNLDSHLALPTVNRSIEELNKTELLPFIRAMDKGVAAVMSAHIVFPAYDSVPATISKRILTDLLRNELNYQGLLISDSMEMKAVADTIGSVESSILAVQAGMDLLCLTHDQDLPEKVFKGLIKAVKDGSIPESRIDEAVTRILKFKKQYQKQYQEGFLNKEFPEIREMLLEKAPKDIVETILDQSLTLVKGEVFKPNGQTLLITTDPIALTIAEDDGNTSSLSSYIERKTKGFTVKKIANDPTEEEVETVLEMAKVFKQIVFCSYNAILFKKQGTLIKTLNEKFGDKLYVISTRLPYDLHVEPKLLNYTCVYEYTPNSVRTLVRYLEGKIIPSGKPLGNML
ncbi:MAG: beta-N-acetylhexosaminidase [Erysipelotrichales bacterium]|nr:beta-N-acetylhexosaminidase [Erysipelotrichales bacterium]